MASVTLPPNGDQALVAGNSDQLLTPPRTAAYVTIDGVGTSRQGIAVAQGFFLALKTKISFSAACSFIAIPIALCITGLGCAITGARWTLPDAIKDVKGARERLEQAQNTCNDILKEEISTKALEEAQKRLEQAERISNGCTSDPMNSENSTKASTELNEARERRDQAQNTVSQCRLIDPETRTKALTELNEAKEAVTVERLGVANHVLYITMGVAQMALGAITLMSAEVAHIWHFTPVLKGMVAAKAALIGGIVLGAVYTVRGTVMVTRSTKSYIKTNAFHEEFRKTLGIESKMGGWKRAEGALNIGINKAITFMKQNTEKYSDASMKTRGVCDTKLSEDATLDKKKSYLRNVDRSIYDDKLKQKISMIIGAAMIIGGIAAIVVSAFFTAGLSLVIIGMISALFFISMESIFITYDSTWAFKKLADVLYHRFQAPLLETALEAGLEDAPRCALPDSTASLQAS